MSAIMILGAVHTAAAQEHGFDFLVGSWQWAIWWVDSRDPHLPMDPPVKGHFENGVGTFYSDGTRFIWSQITPTSARWEQAVSKDGGQTWETNWIMEWRRR